MNDTRDHAADVPWSQWWGMAFVATAILAGLEFMVYRGLTPLERGEQADVAVWAPIAMVYEMFGYISAMLIIPALWCLLACIIGWQTLVRFRAERKKYNDDQPVH